MKKLFLGTIFALVLSLFLQVNAFAEENHPPLLVDEANLLTAIEEEKLLELLEDVSQRGQCDVVIVTVDSMGDKNSQEYADDYFDYNGYGYGSTYDGIILLISMEYRDWAISTCGFGITAFTDWGLDYLEDAFLGNLSQGDYEEAFTVFAQTCDQIITQARQGDAFDVDTMPKGPLPLFNIPLAILIGAVISLIIVFIMKGQLKSVKRQQGAENYLEQNSFKLTDSRELYLYHTVTRHAIPKQTSSSSSSRGGSSVHRSSSGRSHGGSRGKF